MSYREPRIVLTYANLLIDDDAPVLQDQDWLRGAVGSVSEEGDDYGCSLFKLSLHPTLTDLEALHYVQERAKSKAPLTEKAKFAPSSGPYASVVPADLAEYLEKEKDRLERRIDELEEVLNELNCPRKYITIGGTVYCIYGTSSISACEELLKKLEEKQECTRVLVSTDTTKVESTKHSG